METKKKKHKGSENLIPLNQRSEEEKMRIIRKGVETRKKKREERLALQKTMRTLLSMEVNNKKQREILISQGFSENDEITNKMLLVTALYRKAIMGDTKAIREIIRMMDKLDLFEETGKHTSDNNITINITPVGEEHYETEQEEQDIWKAENGIPLEPLDEENDEWDTDGWGDDVYEP